MIATAQATDNFALRDGDPAFPSAEGAVGRDKLPNAVKALQPFFAEPRRVLEQISGRVQAEVGVHHDCRIRNSPFRRINEFGRVVVIARVQRRNALTVSNRASDPVVDVSIRS